MRARDLTRLPGLVGTDGPPHFEPRGNNFAEVLALGVDLHTLNPEAAQGVRFLLDRLRTTFIVPAVESQTTEELYQLWDGIALAALRQVDAAVVLIHEATHATNSPLAAKRLEHADTLAINQLAQRLAEASTADADARIRGAAALLSESRSCLRDLIDESEPIVPELLVRYHIARLHWAIGVALCCEAADRSSTLLPNELRPDLVSDVVEFAESGARQAGVLAAIQAGLDIGWLGEHGQDNPFRHHAAVSFLLQASRIIPRYFPPHQGEAVRFRIEQFDYPDEPSACEYHVVIDSPLAPDQASQALDRLCEEWWDERVAASSVELFPVLGVLNDRHDP